MLLSDKYPYLTDYFTKSLSSNRHPLPQSLIFYGSDFEAQYILANEIARFLNCKNNKEDDCECINCKWIKTNTHPAVLTVSPKDNKPEKDSSKTVVSLEQVHMIQEQLINSSEFHRVYIFCNRETDGNICGIDKIIFPETTANAMLKMIEEPQPGVTFIFLTKSIDNILSTIVSRSQCFFVPSKKTVDFGYENITEIFGNYWEFKRADAFDISIKLQELAEKLDTITVLNEMQNYILAVLKNNPQNMNLIKNIKDVELAKAQTNIGIKLVNVFDDLCLKLIV
ncbi:MAG: hypothetical protein MJ237_07140 [bacterium]|nr:hypothetical protein [bacterium]